MKLLIFILIIFTIGCGKSKDSTDQIQSLISLSKLNFISNSYLATNELSISSNITKNQVLLNLKNCESVIYSGSLILPEKVSEKKTFVIETNTFNLCYGNSIELSIEKTNETISDIKPVFLVNIFGENYKMYLY